jgi:hypothetical protein
MGLGMAGNLARLVKSQQAPASLARKVCCTCCCSLEPNVCSAAHLEWMGMMRIHHLAAHIAVIA